MRLAAAYSESIYNNKKLHQFRRQLNKNSQPQIESVQPADAQQKGQSAEDVIAHAFKNKLSNVQVEGTGQSESGTSR